MAAIIYSGMDTGSIPSRLVDPPLRTKRRMKAIDEAILLLDDVLHSKKEGE